MNLSRAAVLLSFVYIVSATHDATTGTDGHSVAQRETNGDRFRRGLGPLPPTRRERNDLTPRASPIPCPKLSSNTGTLQIRQVSNGEKIGYLGKKFNRENAYTVHPGPDAALHVLVPPVAPFDVTINLIATDAPDLGHLFLGAVANGQGELGHGEAGAAFLSGTSAVRGSSPPSSSAGTSLTSPGHGGIESQIWTMNCQTRQITAQWTNADESQPQTTIFYDPESKRRESFLGLTGDLEALNIATGANAEAVVSPLFEFLILFRFLHN
ncbi:hypothetical protein K438DRAFT_1761502 [Mycena galopus ATCC 62051]|nr:hypothetical protein K438DRAFT_1761502 [Mycena galopus ATCC 62051]